MLTMINFHKTIFRASYTDYNTIPVHNQYPEIAFIGRSNVGKSSLINAVIGQGLARTSKTPGRTRQLNFFDVDAKVTIVDMPGYGYAQLSRKETWNWGKFISYYIANRPQLSRIFVLIDARRGVMDLDIQMLSLISKTPVQTQIILTKIDKVSNLELSNVVVQVKSLLKRFGMCLDDVVCISSKSKKGIDLLRELIASIA